MRRLVVAALMLSLISGATSTGASPPLRAGRIVFADPEAGGGYRMLAVLPDGRGRTLLTREGGLFPSASSDGTRLAFQRDDLIWIADANGRRQRRFMRGYAPSWSPDGRRIVFWRTGGTYIARVDGSRVMRLNSRTPDFFAEGPRWAPAGGLIAFTASHSGGDASLYVIHSDGTRLVDLSTRIGGGGDFSYPTWSPDGRRLAFVRCLPDPQNANAETADLVITQPDGSRAQTITRVRSHRCPTHLAWSPDGRSFAYYLMGPPPREKGPSGIQLMAADGRSAKTVVRDAGYYGLCWQPLP